MKLRCLIFLFLFLVGCSGSAPRQGGTPAPAAGPQFSVLRINLELPQKRALDEVATVSVEVSDPNPPFNLVNGPVVTPVPEGARSVQTSLQVTPGRYRLSVFGYNEQGQLIAQSSPVILDMAIGQIIVQTISLLTIEPDHPVEPPVATSLQFAVQPPVSVNAGDLFSTQVAVLDQNGALFTAATDPITLSLGSNPGASTLSGTLTVTPSNGVAQFSGLSLDLAGTGYTLVASATGLAPATSNPFDVLPPTLLSIAITPNPVSLMGLTPQQLTATGTFSDGSTADISGQVTWNSLNLAVATVSSTGVVTGTGSAGTATITATLNGVTGSVLATSTSGLLPRGNRAFLTPGQADYDICLDVNQDGRDDVLITAQLPGAVGVYQMLTQADGTLGAASLIDTETATPNKLIKGNLDNANGLDFILLKGDGVKVFLSDGAGGFTTQNLPTGMAQIWGDVGDIDGDGDLDLVTNEGVTNLVTFFNNGAGSFSAGATLAAGGQGVTVADFNGDSRADVGLAFGANVRVYLAGVGGVFGAFTAVPMPVGGNALDVDSGNFDGVNGIDLVATDTANNRIVMFLNNGAAVFGIGTNINTSTNFGVFRVRVADFEGDGDLDVGYTNIGNNSFVPLVNSGSATFTQGPSAAGAGVSAELDFGNLDGINGLDCVTSCVSTSEPGATVFLEQGGGTYFANPVLSASVGSSLAAVGNFDNANGLDIAVANGTTNQVQVYLNTGGRNYAAPLTLVSGAGPTCVVTGDFNQDGLDDIVTVNNGSGNLSLFLSNGAGFNAPSSITLTAGANPLFAAVGNFDGVNGPDLAITQTNSIRVLLNSGAGAFPTQTGVALAVDPQDVAAGDLDGSGLDDVAVAGGAASSLVVLLNGGNGTAFSQNTNNLAGAVNVSNVAIGDFDGVNGPDLATVTTQLSVLLNQGAGTFGAAINSPAVAAFNLVAADMDQNGVQDIVGSNESLGILTGQGNGSFASEIRLGAFHQGTAVIAVGDLDGDGHPDVVYPYQGTAFQPALVQLIFGQ